MIVTGIERQKKNPDRFAIFVDGEFAVGVRSAVLLASGLRKGDEITGEKIDRLKDDEELGMARATATRYIDARRRTEWEVRRRLGTREFPPHVIDRVVRDLVSAGQIDDRAYISAFVHDAQLRKPTGARMLAAKLRRKGLGRELIGEMLPRALPGEEEERLAMKSARGYLSKLERRARAGRITSPGKMRAMLRTYLAGRGFDGSAAAAAMKVLPPDAGNTD